MNDIASNILIERDIRDVLLHIVKPILDWVLNEDIEEIAINRPEEIWLKLRKPVNNEVWVRRQDKILTYSYLKMMIQTLANSTNTGNFGPHGNPVCYGTLNGGHRYVGALGPNFQYDSGEINPVGTILFCARQSRPDMAPNFQALGLERGKELSTISSMFSRKADTTDAFEKLMLSMNRGDHIMVSGATGTGKTTLLNKIIGMLDSNLRILTIEDTSEIKVNQLNHAHIIMNRGNQTNLLDYKGVVDLIVRMVPDCVMGGEVSTSNAATLWELMRSGHGHFMTTIHAESTNEALSSFITRIGHTEPGAIVDRPRLLQEMRDKIRIIQVNKDRVTNARKIIEVL